MPGTGPNNREEPSGSLASDRLDSWKEIAAYLKRDERTVRRWEEREGLPIHRHQLDFLVLRLHSIRAIRKFFNRIITEENGIGEPKAEEDTQG